MWMQVGLREISSQTSPPEEHESCVGVNLNGSLTVADICYLI